MGGGGDGGYGARQEEQDRRKQAARNALNVAFGVAPGPGSAVDREQFTRPGAMVSDGEGAVFEGAPVFDQAAFDAASGASAEQTAESAKNKAALEALYGGVRSSSMAAGKRRLDEGKADAGRGLKFELFARGLNGGSVDVDQNNLLGRTYTSGVTDLGGKADSAVASLKAGDEGARLQLLQSIDNGMDQGSALSSALAQMKNNAEKAGAEAIGANVGDIFSNAGLLYERERRARGEQRAGDWMSQFAASGGRARGAPAGIFSRTE